MAGVAHISRVELNSPAYDAGFTPGCKIISVDKHSLSDILDWRWYSSGNSIELEYVDTENDHGTILLEREEGQDWGFSFSDSLFDGTRQCCNACTFCFMRQLPQDSRDTLLIRDDDFRLSFLQGTFVTFTNISEEDVARIIEQRLSPLRFSLHAISSDLRKKIIGKHAHRGIEVAETLLDAGIKLHAQIVLMPHVNDGEELIKTLNWAYKHKNILSVGIVPVGYTKHQTYFKESFTSPASALPVIDLITPFQQKALQQRNQAWVHASDEFYRYAYPDTLLNNLPPASYYGNFDLFEDGIGIIRSFIDDFRASGELANKTARILKSRNKQILYVSGFAQQPFLDDLIKEMGLQNLVIPLYVKNDYFGGNVDVTGLLCACDIVPTLKKARAKTGISLAAIPEVVFNSDGLTLDNKNVHEIAEASGLVVHSIPCQASDFLPRIATIATLQEREGRG